MISMEFHPTNSNILYSGEYNLSSGTAGYTNHQTMALVGVKLQVVFLLVIVSDYLLQLHQQTQIMFMY